MRQVFLDTETTGLLEPYQNEEYDEPWEVAVIIRTLDSKGGRAEPDQERSWFVEHNTSRAEHLPKNFRIDYEQRYRADQAISREELAHNLTRAFATGNGTRPTLIGQVPNFDTVRLSPLMRRVKSMSPWHYQIKDLESVALGYIQAKLTHCDALTPGRRAFLNSVVETVTHEGKSPRSDTLSLALGINPDDYDRHTSIGDCRWTRDQWDVIFNPDWTPAYLRARW